MITGAAKAETIEWVACFRSPRQVRSDMREQEEYKKFWLIPKTSGDYFGAAGRLYRKA